MIIGREKAMISVYGIAHTGYWNTVQSEVTADNLFME